MAKEDSTYGLDPKRLARLLALAADDASEQANAGDSQTAAEILLGLLSSKPTLDTGSPNSVPPLQNEAYDKLLGAANQAIGDLILDSKTDLAIMRILKNHAKELTRRASSTANKTATTVLYYAAIAGAVVFHEQKISKRSYGELQKAYACLSQKQWIPTKMRNLFKRAEDVCREQA